MAAAAFTVPVADLRRGPVKVSWTVPLAWLREALEDTEATPTGDGKLGVELTANGSYIIVRGEANVAVTMPCARTLEPVSVALNPEIFLLLTPAAPLEPQPRAPRGPGSGRSARRRRSADGPHRTGRRGKKGGSGWENDPPLSEELAAQDTYDGEQVVLDSLVREFILLDLPMNPLRSDLPLAEDAAIGPPSESGDSVSGAEQPVDPRLAPLAAIARRLRQDKE